MPSADGYPMKWRPQLAPALGPLLWHLRRGIGIFILGPRTESALLGRVEPAVLLSGLCRFHWVLDQHPLDLLALRTFEGPQIGMGRAKFDPGQHRAALTLGAAWPFNGN